MLVKSVTPQEVVKFLNELIAIDNSAVNELLKFHTGCNKAMADHPTVQVISNMGIDGVGILGLLNGMFGTNEWGYGCIAAVFDNKTLELTKFNYIEDLGKGDATFPPSVVSPPNTMEKNI